jgi:predicted restriction endonuclease
LHQTFFRQAILSSYQTTCITGINVPDCLVAAHIIPWGVSEQLRADPRNGLCLSATFDRLFDAGLVAISADYVVLVADSLRRRGPGPTRDIIASTHGRPIHRPQRFMPSTDHLKWHLENIFKH